MNKYQENHCLCTSKTKIYQHGQIQQISDAFVGIVLVIPESRFDCYLVQFLVNKKIKNSKDYIKKKTTLTYCHKKNIIDCCVCYRTSIADTVVVWFNSRQLITVMTFIIGGRH